MNFDGLIAQIESGTTRTNIPDPEPLTYERLLAVFEDLKASLEKPYVYKPQVFWMFPAEYASFRYSAALADAKATHGKVPMRMRLKSRKRLMEKYGPKPEDFDDIVGAT